MSDRETLVKKVSIVPLEIIVRNIAAGSFSKRYGVAEGVVFETPTIEFSYKNDELGDPLMDEYHAIDMKQATKEEIETIKKYAFGVNEQLKVFWTECGVTFWWILNWNSADSQTALSYLPMRSVLTPADYWTAKTERNWIK
nr:phosphoribosylaminoimidazolesuccinocarboxamide synthase [Bacteroides caecimuris]